MDRWKCQYAKDCSNKGIKKLWRFDYSRPPISGDAFGAAALPPTPQQKFIVVCGNHLEPASFEFMSEVQGWKNPLDCVAIEEILRQYNVMSKSTEENKQAVDRFSYEGWYNEEIENLRTALIQLGLREPE